MSEYVFPHCKRLENKIKQLGKLNRLFAYPTEPHFDNHKLVILDSGAFGLSQQNKSINKSYMFKLSKHYEHYKSMHDNMLCIAPDIFKDPFGSITNIKKWRAFKLFKDITPVLQNSERSIIDIDELKYQVDFYTSLGYNTLCYSLYNTNGTLHKQQNIDVVFKYAKSKNVKHIHCLGAGWDIQDIRVWQTIEGWNTMDSIQYYATKNVNDYGSLNPLDNIKTILNLFDVNNV